MEGKFNSETTCIIKSAQVIQILEMFFKGKFNNETTCIIKSAEVIQILEMLL